jgi:putative flippase GtrA
MHERFKKIIKQVVSQSFLTFLIVGVINTLIDALIFNAVLVLLVANSFEMELIAAKSLGFIAASTNSYFLNARWTFKSSKALTKRNYLVFLCVSAGGLLVNVIAAYAIYFSVHTFLPLHQGIAANIAFAGATFASLLWNYVGYKKFVFTS